MAPNKNLVVDPRDHGMEEIEALYARLFSSEEGPENGGWRIHPDVKSRLHKKILEEIENLRGSQRRKKFGSSDYWELDRRIRRRVLKEIQIIMDAYLIALQNGRVAEWESMYGDIEHYKRDFFYFRMDTDYESMHKMLQDYKYVDGGK